ncbi:2-hydroxyacid dehydrogenase [Salinithrix halophila]|uniref:2-hydroxyacid dehydrogenase n=1 Tax=Salinithrix halophila TaxID=1485204 RepID=A0ABV8JJB5_9BACL
MADGMRPRILVTRELPAAGMKLLEQYCEVETGGANRGLSRRELIGKLADKDGLVSLLTDQVDRPVMDASPRLKVISNYAVGYDNIDVEEATRRGIAVTNTPDVLTDSTADMAWALLMDVARRVTEGDRLNRAGGWTEWAPLFHLGKEVTGSTLGIVGMGRIGRAVARRAKGFDMKICYFSRTRLPEEEERSLGSQFLSLEELLATADFVSLHAPYTAETHHLIGRKELTAMKPTAYLINTARGALVDEEALVEAIRKREIAGAGLDVYEKEPKMAPGLSDLEQVVLAPHLGSATRETRDQMAATAAENVLSILLGKGKAHRVHA